MIQTNEKITCKGILEVKLIDLQGKVIGGFIDNNLVVLGGRANIVQLLGAPATTRHITKIGFGTNGNAVAIGDNTLTNSFVKPLTGYSFPTSNSISFSINLATSEANGLDIREWGLITESDVLFSRLSRDSILKQSTFSIQGTWTLTF